MTLQAWLTAAGGAVALVLLGWLALTRTVLGRGLAVPLRAMFVRPETAQYPEAPRDPAPRFHGRHQLNRYEDGLEKCIGCELCAWACPADAIFVQGADNTEERRYSPGERYAEDYQVNYNRCILCGLCIEACPTRALTMTQDYELAADSRDGLIWTKDMLLVDPVAGAYETPHTDREVRDRGINYYGGLAVTPPTRKGGSFAPATAAPLQRAGTVVPRRELPLVPPSTASGAGDAGAGDAAGAPDAATPTDGGAA